MTARTPTISETLRKAIEESPVSRYQIAKATGIDNATLCRFVQGGSLKAETIDKLAVYFGLVLSPIPNASRMSA